MFKHLDLTLETIIKAAPLPELANVGVSFETPDKNFNPAGKAVDLFLYEVNENRTLRDPVPVTRKNGETFTRQRPPLRIDCTYVVTAWVNPPNDVNVREAHQLLAQTLLWLSRFPTIPAGFFQGDLADQPFPPPTMVAQMDASKQSVGEFWSALGIPPRPYFNLVVTVAMDLPQPIEGPLVITKFTEAEPVPTALQDTLVAIGGRIVDAAGQGIAEAVVDILDVGRRTASDADGRYVFARVPADSHSFRVVAVGFAPRTITIEVPGRSEDYVIQLSPL